MIPYLFFLQDGFLLQHFNCVELLIASVAGQKNLSKAAFSDDLKEIKVWWFGGGVGRRAEIYLLRRTWLERRERWLGKYDSYVVSQKDAWCMYKHMVLMTQRNADLPVGKGCCSSAQHLVEALSSRWTGPQDCRKKIPENDDQMHGFNKDNLENKEKYPNINNFNF